MSNKICWHEATTQEYDGKFTFHYDEMMEWWNLLPFIMMKWWNDEILLPFIMMKWWNDEILLPFIMMKWWNDEILLIIYDGIGLSQTPSSNKKDVTIF